MLSKKTIRGVTIAVLALAALLNVNTVAFAQDNVSKTPILTPETVILEEVNPYTPPENYPQALIDHYDANMDARSYIVVDVETNRVLAQQEGNMPYPIASMTKILSSYLILEAIEAGELSLDQMISIPQEIEDHLSFNPELSAVGLYADEEYSVEDLLYGVLLQSGNDATSALMWELYGSEQAGVQAMTDQLNEWGITNFQLYTVSGVPNENIPENWWVPGSNASSENIMSASDVALMAQYIIEDHPEILEITSTTEYAIKEGTELEQIVYNPNQLLPGGTYGREGITGMKSGFTDGAGRSFVATGNENGRDVIAVAMGTFGEGMSAYWEIEILLDGLLDYPDMYTNEDLPVNIQPTEADQNELLEGTDGSDQSGESGETEGQTNIENQRDNPLTNFMRDIFGVFN